MKVIITGHTNGIGKYLYDRFSEIGWQVIGLSRSTGYDITVDSDVDRIIELSTGADIFVNNAYCGKGQLDLLNRLYDKVDKMIVFGSIAGDYHQIINSQYSEDKKELQERCRNLSLLPGNNILHLKISMLEDAVSSDNLIPYSEILNIINLWINRPYTTNIDTAFKLTPFTLQQLKTKFGASQEAIDHVLQNMCKEKKQHF